MGPVENEYGQNSSARSLYSGLYKETGHHASVVRRRQKFTNVALNDQTGREVFRELAPRPHQVVFLSALKVQETCLAFQRMEASVRLFTYWPKFCVGSS
jgi:hypothetical protein